MKTCTKCTTEKSIDEFVPIYDRPGKYRSVCRVCHRKDSAKHRATNRSKRRELIDSFKDRPCADCGKTYPPYVMDFDHLGDKLFNIADGTNSMTTQQVIDEIAKCEIVCSNCHRIRSHQRLARD